MSSPCKHLSTAKLQAPRLSQQVHREECTQCFDDQDGLDGVVICLQCFNGGCTASDRAHAKLHADRSNHPFGMRIKRTRRHVERSDQEPPMKKLAIVVPKDEDVYETQTEFLCFECSTTLPDDDSLVAIKTAIMTAASSAQQSEVKAWEEELEMCEHALTLEQGSAKDGVSSHCSQCELASNLWLCLTCGDVNCGRKQHGGADGNGHALAHFEATGHGVGVKLGTITPEGGGDIYCYICNDARLDPDLPKHLERFNIQIAGQEKTEKSMTELQIEQNMKHEFSMTGDDGQELQPVFGPGLTGLKNLGNSCYMASVLQSIFALPSFQTRYHPSGAQRHFAMCPLVPAECLECQMFKMSDGLLSGRYSVKVPHAASHFQEGIRPSMFKALVGKGHAEFSTMRQQDSEEFLQHLIKCLRRGHMPEATDGFKFALEQKLQCTECQGVRYRADESDSVSLPVPANPLPPKEGAETSATEYEAVDLSRCLELLTGGEELEYSCPACKKSVVAQKKASFKTFPDVLVVHMQKFQLVNWMPTKIDVPINVPDTLTMDEYLGKGKQEDEVELADEPEAALEQQFNPAALSQLEAMGFPLVRCQKALLATGNEDAEAAMNWLFQHMEDADIDEPLTSATKSSTSAQEPSAEQVSTLADMGFTTGQAKKALRETGGDAERAIEWLFSHPDDMGEDAAASSTSTATPSKTLGGSAELPAKYRLKAFISHKGPSVHSGHYVATIKQEDDTWVLFNDEKVVLAEGEGNEKMKSLAYLYIYERM